MGRSTIAVHLQPLNERALWRATLNEAELRAVLDGVSALRAGGLVGFEDVIHLSVPPGSRARSRPNVFSRLCRQRGLPPPDRQVVRKGRKVRVYLDVYWDVYWDVYRVVVEIEGIHHDAPENAVDDSLRQNDLAIRRNAVLRIPMVGIRTCFDEFMDQVETMLRAAGGCPAA